MVTVNTTITFLLSSLSYFYSSENKDLIVATKYGKIQGSTSTSRGGLGYYEFLGIPYAQPPIGDLRFESPIPPEPWTDVKSTTSTPYECLQIHIALKAQTGDENCLYLNVHTHQIQPSTNVEPIKKLHPVIVYLHGGIFMFGGGRIYGGRYFMDHDVVLVVVQYRVGAFGFLNTGDGVVRGNMALKDQVLALKWVQENIQLFGGDPNHVTLVGQSAGAHCAHLHMLSPMSRGLFHQVITQSGNALSPWGIKVKPVEQAHRFATKVQCPTNSTIDMVKCLKAMDATVLVQGHDDYPWQLYDRLVIFGPTIETVINDTNTFLDDDPIHLLQNTDRSMLIPWLNGVNSEEGLLFAAKMLTNDTIRHLLKTNWTYYAPLFLDLQDHPNQVQLVQQIHDYYFGPNTTELNLSFLKNLTNMISDRNFFQSIHELSGWHTAVQARQALGISDEANKINDNDDKQLLIDSQQIPPMLFPQALDAVISTGVQWVSTNVFGYEPTHYGAGHADEIFIMFKLPILTQHEAGTKDYEMSKKMIDIWTTFAIHGRPDLSKSLNGCWPAVGQSCSPKPLTMNDGGDDDNDEVVAFQYMKLDNESHLIDEPFKERIEFWKSLGLTKLNL